MRTISTLMTGILASIKSESLKLSLLIIVIMVLIAAHYANDAEATAGRLEACLTKEQHK